MNWPASSPPGGIAAGFSVVRTMFTAGQHGALLQELQVTTGLNLGNNSVRNGETERQPWNSAFIV
jgi:hypothetical protein